MKILIVKLSSIGDICHVLPTVEALRTQLDAEIHWAVQSEFASLVACVEGVSRVIPIDRRRWWRGVGASLGELRETSYDLIVDLQGLLKSALVARAARGRRRIGPSFQREGARVLYHEVAGPPRPERHAVVKALDVLDHLGLQRPDPVTFPALDLPAPELTDARPRVALLPVSRWETKNWPLSYFAELARRLMTQAGASVVVCGGGADREAGEAIVAEAPGALNACGLHALPETGGLLRQMDLVVANDTGPLHLAVALGVPCLVLYGPTAPARTGPYGPLHRVLQVDLPCRPCLSRRCRVGGIPCMASISTDEVFAAAWAMLA